MNGGQGDPHSAHRIMHKAESVNTIVANLQNFFGDRLICIDITDRVFYSKTAGCPYCDRTGS
jgi:hypothetical protein